MAVNDEEPAAALVPLAKATAGIILGAVFIVLYDILYRLKIRHLVHGQQQLAVSRQQEEADAGAVVNVQEEANQPNVNDKNDVEVAVVKEEHVVEQPSRIVLLATTKKSLDWAAHGWVFLQVVLTIWFVFLTIWFAMPTGYCRTVLPSIANLVFDWFWTTIVIHLIWRRQVYPSFSSTRYESYRLRVLLIASIFATDCAAALLLWASPSEGDTTTSNGDDDGDGSEEQDEADFRKHHMTLALVYGCLALFTTCMIGAADCYKHRYDSRRNAGSSSPDSGMGLLDEPMPLMPEEELLCDGIVVRQVLYAMLLGFTIIFGLITLITIAVCAGANGACGNMD